ncbi:hypothetical protein ACWU37_21275 (plasmid) [Photobacterium damselae subsp. damselae]
MVKIDYSSGFYNGGELAFFIDNYATLKEIDDRAVDYACDTMMNNEVGGKVVMPVLYRSFDASLDSKPKLIGRIALSIVDDVVIVEHLTLNGDVVNSEWSVTDFYNGKYGLANA